jgi:hypothetical protein
MVATRGTRYNGRPCPCPRRIDAGRLDAEEKAQGQETFE